MTVDVRDKDPELQIVDVSLEVWLAMSNQYNLTANSFSWLCGKSIFGESDKDRVCALVDGTKEILSFCRYNKTDLSNIKDHSGKKADLPFLHVQYTWIRSLGTRIGQGKNQYANKLLGYINTRGSNFIVNTEGQDIPFWEDFGFTSVKGTDWSVYSGNYTESQAQVYVHSDENTSIVSYVTSRGIFVKVTFGGLSAQKFFSRVSGLDDSSVLERLQPKIEKFVFESTGNFVKLVELLPEGVEFPLEVSANSMDSFGFDRR